MKLNYKKLDDIELVNLLKTDRHKDGAFAEIYERYSKRLYAYCRKMLHNTEDANDIFQETIMKFYHHIQSHSLYGNIMHLLLKIARNLFLNHVRDTKKNVEFDEFITPYKGLEQENFEMTQLLNIAINTLKDDQKEVFVLRIYEGLSYEEISEIIGDNLSSTRSRCWRAKEKVKNIISKYLNELEINNKNI